MATSPHSLGYQPPQMARPLSGIATQMIFVIQPFMERYAADEAALAALQRECKLVELDVMDAKVRIEAEARKQGKIRREIEELANERRHRCEEAAAKLDKENKTQDDDKKESRNSVDMSRRKPVPVFKPEDLDTEDAAPATAAAADGVLQPTTSQRSLKRKLSSQSSIGSGPRPKKRTDSVSSVGSRRKGIVFRDSFADELENKTLKKMKGEEVPDVSS